ncbi:Sensor kinase protein RcsC [Thalassovita gelatinovora]|uniref:histidine kinase n=1 Tax=Thalassovita gelatinovora TaxID=53501 RepID=A0A0P1FXX2_THAGE|nr:ATP-binding protein [Thalassovita gelatinovora]QIZ80645.1 response regulator [Thalassovita gelatinovora]CUH65203.1 Sensor kinase protein RcsC [Thalassovita gelatinovora]SEQ87402.1 PAS domain S-box-containing protein [Thalassovita gelatinovora]
MERNIKSLIVMVYLLAAGTLITGYLIIDGILDKNYRNTLSERLLDGLHSTEFALDFWVEAHKREAVAMAKLDIVQSAAHDLLEIRNDRAALIDHPDQQRLRDFFGHYLSNDHIEGYFLIAPDGTSLASSRVSNTGTSNLLLKQSDLYFSALAGQTVMTRLQESEVPLSDETTPRGNATLFALAPIRQQDGQVIALFALRLSPRAELFPLIDGKLPGAQLRSYAFDSDGNLLSMVAETENPNDHNIWNQGDARPLTAPNATDPTDFIMPVREALRGVDGLSTEGYENYAGVENVGAWSFNDALGMGIVTEIDKKNAYQMVAFFKKLTFIAFALGLLVSTLVFLAMLLTTRHADKQRRMVESVLSATKDVNLLLNAQGIITEVNPAFRNVFGLAREAAIGEPITTFAALYSDQDCDLSPQGLKTLGYGETDRILRARGIGRGDNNIPIGLRVERLTSVNQGDTYLVVIHDYRDIAKREATLREALNKAEAANRTKASFLSTISHELRSPLISVISAIELIVGRATNAEDRNLLDASQRSAQLLLGTIDDILDFSRMESGNLDLSNQDVVLENVLENVTDTLRWQAWNNDVRLIPYCTPDLPVVQADGLRLRQILVNLIGNAIKFSAQMPRNGEVKVSILPGIRHGDTQQVILQVRDNGIGMTQETIDQIFQPFTQADGSIRRHYGGTGLGLALTDRLVQLMDGTISVSSNAGSGSTFEVKIPLRFAPPEPAALPMDAPKPLAGNAILFKGRNSDIRDIVRSYVESAGALLLENGLPQDTNRDIKPDYVIVYAETVAELKELSQNVGDVALLEIVNTVEDNDQISSDSRMAVTALLPSLLVRKLTDLKSKPVRKPATVVIPQSKVLLIEDDKMTRDITMRMLQELGIAADAVANGKEGLELWRSGKYALLLSDCHMPIMDGFQMAACIRDEEMKRRLPKTPIVAVSADLTMEIEQLCQTCEINEYIPKPLTPAKLKALMASYASNGKAHHDA